LEKVGYVSVSANQTFYDSQKKIAAKVNYLLVLGSLLHDRLEMRPDFLKNRE
jgi:hypothetical protein